ncbi:MAG TPA: DNA-binding protein [Actinomycetota bacterium]
MVDGDGELVDVREVAMLLDLTRQRVHQLKRRADFPRPARIGVDGALWERRAIEGWASAHPCGGRRWGARGSS